VSGLADKIVALHEALAARDIPHAFGGALALAWCTQRARATIDIDLNVFVGEDRARDVVTALPPPISDDERDILRLQRDGQARLWWDETPVDVFLNTTRYHDEVATRIHWEPFAGQEIPFLACTDLAVFKAFFNRTRDWADLEDMATAGTLDRGRVLGVLAEYLGSRDERLERLRGLGGAS
jgi:hypothetical protein